MGEKNLMEKCYYICPYCGESRKNIEPHIRSSIGGGHGDRGNIPKDWSKYDKEELLKKCDECGERAFLTFVAQEVNRKTGQYAKDRNQFLYEHICSECYDRLSENNTLITLIPVGRAVNNCLEYNFHFNRYDVSLHDYWTFLAAVKSLQVRVDERDKDISSFLYEIKEILEWISKNDFESLKELVSEKGRIFNLLEVYKSFKNISDIFKKLQEMAEDGGKSMRSYEGDGPDG